MTNSKNGATITAQTHDQQIKIINIRIRGTGLKGNVYFHSTRIKF